MSSETRVPTYRVFEVMQFEYNPKTGYRKDGEPKKNAKPLMTQAQLEAGLNHKLIKQWAWAFHDKDIYSEEDESPERPWVHAGDPKPAHWHIRLRVDHDQTIETICRWFGLPMNLTYILVKTPHGRGAFPECIEYLTHESDKEQAAGKYRYPDVEIHANFDWRALVDDNNEKKARFGSRAGNMTDADTMRMHVLQDGWSLEQCAIEDPLTYAKIRNSLNGLRLDYLQKQPAPPLRLNYYIDGKSGLGKSSLSDYLGEVMFPGVEHPIFHIGNDERVSFDGYDGEPVIVWDDMRAYDFIERFRRDGTFRLLNTHPQNEAKQVKGSRVILTNAVNIINGIQPYEQFLDGLAGEYVDKMGMKHLAESKDKDQAYRRFPMIICLRDTDFDVMFNKGFYEKTRAYLQYEMYGCVTGNFHDVMARLDGEAKEKTLVDMTATPLQLHEELKRINDDKISDPAKIPDEFAAYGTVITPEQAARDDAARAAAQAQVEAEARAADKARRVAMMAKSEEIFTAACDEPARHPTADVGSQPFDPKLRNY